MLTKQALTIGINAYEPSHLVLRPCRNDATDLSSSLRSMGFQVQNGLDLDLYSMKSVTKRFVDSIQPGAIVFYYFSGHGVQCNGENYLVPTNARDVHANNIDSTTIGVQNLIDSMYQRRPRLIVCILDCCRTQPPKKPLDGFNLHKNALAGTRPGLGPMRTPPSTIIVYACAANDTASAQSKNGRNSLYTYHLLRHIKTPNTDIETVMKRVAVDVQRDSNNEQVPYRYSSCNELIYLLSNERPRPPVVAQHIRQRKPIIRMFVFDEDMIVRLIILLNLEPMHGQHRKAPVAAAAHYPDLQLNGRFGLPVYRYLSIQNKAPGLPRMPLGYGYGLTRAHRYY